ncbi:G-alpha-domain-containing protein [Laetiporus sulphureus 93-53]|uniref:G-alpha-domain-containing protein n=1 Tax=Laetiporus sulphureus 93-53 TaxID=1314785 RepID=A0A165F506_9APHY|nr:G-alpha-domain-containing protein [Laetiporus sulphureus 93-53]KZT08404.1 G-alpha-domain-containing protein [Laetiporus sulphureus 93-53]
MVNDWPPYPPLDETELEKAVRLEEENVAKRISDEIDRAIEHDRQEMRKKRHQTKILLLGQAESGKSTLLKNFQLQFAPKAFHAEAEGWRAVIQLNLVRSINVILSLLSKANSNPASPSPPPRFSKPKDDLRWLKVRLAPLRQVEVILNRLLGVNPDETDDADLVLDSGRLSEVAIRSNCGWQTLMRTERSSPSSRFLSDLDDARRILEACRDDIVSMCEDAVVRRILHEQGVVLLNEPGFFFDQAERIASMTYEPTPEDILRARLRTVGVEEHRLVMETLTASMEKGREWVFYDVGGARGQRATWASYFEDVNAVMFLCPLSGFDQVLSEDRAVNRLIDTMKLWKVISSSKLLQNATFVLFLNKSDILRKKLDSGVLFRDHIEQYKDQPNDFDSVTTYIKKVLLAIHKDNTPKKRDVHVHITCATDTNMMSIVLNSIHDVILMNALETTSLIS